MSTNFPTSLDDATSIPVESAGTALSTNHITNHQNVQDAIEAIEAKIGVNGSAVTTSHDYKLSGVTGTDKAVSKTGTETLTNKTLTSPIINTPKIAVGSDAVGDLHITSNADGTQSRIAIGANNYILKSNGTTAVWGAETSTVDASTTVKGLVEASTSAEVTAGTATGGTGAPLVVTPDALASSSYNDYAIFGDGNDGDVTISSGTTTISRDMYYNNLTIQTGGILNPSGFRIYVRGTITFEGTGKIARNGNTGGNGGNGANGVAGAGNSAGGTAGTAGAALAAGTIAGAAIAGAGATGGAGTTGDSTPGAGGAQAPAPSNISTAVGSSASNGSGSGGNGGGGFSGVAGGNGGALRNGATVTNPTVMPRTANNAILLHYINDTTIGYMNGSAPAPGGASGGGGAGGNQGAGSATGGAGGGSGGGGGTGGIVMVAANTISGGYATCIQALGGTGGNGGNGGNGSASHAGGGGGGSGGTGGTGGVVCFVYRKYSGTPLDTNCVAGGAGGTKGTGGTPGTGGTAGTDGVDGATGATGKLYTIIA